MFGCLGRSEMNCFGINLKGGQNNFWPTSMTSKPKNIVLKTIVGLILVLTISACSPKDSEDECGMVPNELFQLCKEAVEMRTGLLDSTNEYKMNRDLVLSETEELPSIIMESATAMEFICKSKNNGFINCVDYATMLALVNNATVQRIINDLNVIADFYNLEGNIAIKCESGNWISISGEEAELVTQDHKISEDKAEEIEGKCDSLGETSDSADPGLGLLTYVTGIDTIGFACIRESGESMSEALTREALNRAHEMANRCVATIAETLMENNDSGVDYTDYTYDANIQDEEDPTGEPPEETTIPTTDEKVVLACTKYGCYYRYRKDGDPPVATTEPKVSQDSNTNAPIVETHTPDGRAVQIRFGRKYPIHRFKKLNGEWGDWQDGAPSFFESEDKPEIIAPPLDCINDLECSVCQSYMEFHPKLENACQGNDLDLCAEFVNTSGCCSDPSIASDPLVAIPNPGTDLVCFNMAPDIQAGVCSLQCQFADENCIENCNKSMVTSFEFNILDQICLYAYADFCVSSDIDLNLAASEPPNPPPAL